MGAEFIVGTLEEMCDLMCDNVVPEKICDTCIYRDKYEYHKPCIVYRDDCEFYEREGDMTREEAIRNLQFVRNNLNDSTKIAKAYDMAIKALEQEPKTGHWIWKDFDDDTGISKSYWCSECNKPLTGLAMNYCGCCGARMIEPQESEG